MKQNNNFFFTSCSVSLILIAFFIVTDANKVQIDSINTEGAYSEEHKESCSDIISDNNLLHEKIKFEKNSIKISLDNRSLDSFTSNDTKSILAFKKCLFLRNNQLEFNLIDTDIISTKEKLSKIFLLAKTLKIEDLDSKNEDLFIKTSFEFNKL
jgi:hypothetical protein